MVTSTNLTIIKEGKRINVYTPSEIKKHSLKAKFLTSLNNILITLKN